MLLNLDLLYCDFDSTLPLLDLLYCDFAVSFALDWIFFAVSFALDCDFALPCPLHRRRVCGSGANLGTLLLRFPLPWHFALYFSFPIVCIALFQSKLNLGNVWRA
ncbi:hypothetical protein Dimus_014188 [Dionaea muscipula]